MDIRRLKTFLAVCETGSLSRAAERLHISQPALTRRIQELESEYGAVLFERAKKGMTPTEAGLLLQVRARQIVNLDNAVRHELESTGAGLAGMVRIGCVETNAAHALARWLRSWRHLHPRSQVEIYAADSDDLKAHLDAGTIDAAVLLAPVEAAKYQNVPLAEKEVWGVTVHKDHPLARETAVTTDMLESFPLMLPHRHILRRVVRRIRLTHDGGGLHQSVDRSFHDARWRCPHGDARSQGRLRHEAARRTCLHTAGS